MSTPNLNVLLQTVLSIQNNLAPNAPQIAYFDFGTLTMGATCVLSEPYLQAVPTVGTSIQFPQPIVYLIAVQNLGPTGSQLVVTVTPQFNPSATFILGPTGLCILFDTTESGAGFTALNLRSGTATTIPAMVIVGG